MKFFSRIVALLLVPCLVADPASTAALSLVNSCCSRRQNVADPLRLTTEALDISGSARYDGPARHLGNRTFNYIGPVLLAMLLVTSIPASRPRPVSGPQKFMTQAE